LGDVAAAANVDENGWVLQSLWFIGIQRNGEIHAGWIAPWMR
jgi:hypothetical protein